MKQVILNGETKYRLYPNGYNPFDSRAEFYLIAGDTGGAISNYERVVNRFSYSTSAINRLRNLKKSK
ncbi:hypothetical protein ACFLU5_04480 [Bacteroidota bacterium]